jgi:hypothetical protein
MIKLSEDKSEEDDECEVESEEDESDDEFEIVKQPQRTTNSKRKIHVDLVLLHYFKFIIDHSQLHAHLLHLIQSLL